MDRWSAMIQNARAANVNAGIADEIALVATLAAAGCRIVKGPEQAVAMLSELPALRQTRRIPKILSITE
jgi:hypothetical protein